MCDNNEEVLDQAPISEAPATQPEAPQSEAQAAQAELSSPLPEAPAEAPAPDTVPVVDVQFQTGCKVYYFDPKDFDLKPHDHVIIETARGPEYGICASGVHTLPCGP